MSTLLIIKHQCIIFLAHTGVVDNHLFSGDNAEVVARDSLQIGHCPTYTCDNAAMRSDSIDL